MKRIATRKTYLYPQGVDIDRFQPARNEAGKRVLKKKLGLWQYKKIVIFIGAIVKRKGVDILVNAWKKIHKEQPEALLLMIGRIPSQIKISIRKN
jgi:glycosyltransferase involved in cell wall biosynthesis